MNRNKIHRLPIYIAEFSQLLIFKIDQNPLEWPPRKVMDVGGNLEDPAIMKDWIHSVQQWIKANSASGAERKMSDDSAIVEHSAGDDNNTSL